MWTSRNKTDLIIEVWEKLDCESVGAAEIAAIETAVASAYGAAAVESPMAIARMLADEGAELRHSEIMSMHVARVSDRPHDAALRKILDTKDLKSTLRSIGNAENLRMKFSKENDREGLRLLRERAIAEREMQLAIAAKQKLEPARRAEAGEIAKWITLWLQSPEVFETWSALRRKSADFVSKFGEI